MGSRQCDIEVVTVTTVNMLSLTLVLLLAASSLSAPQLPPGVDPVACPNYPFCGAGPAPVQDNGLAAHAAAEAAVLAKQAQFPAGASGVVGPSGNIGPSGLCGPSGCIAFRK